MKKNLISILILALLVVNLVLTSIMMISVAGTAKKTSALIGDIASVLNLELTNGADPESAVAEVPMKNVEVYDIADQMTIPLQVGEDGKEHYCMVMVSLSLNTKADGYKEYGSTIAEKESLIKSKITERIGSHTIEEAKSSAVNLQDEILQDIQELFGSEFIFQVVFRDIMFQ